MKIKIKAENNYEEKDTEIEFTDESLDNDNFVDMVVGEKLYGVSIDDLHSAVEAFRTKRYERLTREKLTK